MWFEIWLKAHGNFFKAHGKIWNHTRRIIIIIIIIVIIILIIITLTPLTWFLCIIRWNSSSILLYFASVLGVRVNSWSSCSYPSHNIFVYIFSFRNPCHCRRTFNFISSPARVRYLRPLGSQDLLLSPSCLEPAVKVVMVVMVMVVVMMLVITSPLSLSSSTIYS